MSPRQRLLRGLSIILWPLLASPPASVFIMTRYGDESVGRGSGVVLNRKGVVITNYLKE